VSWNGKRTRSLNRANAGVCSSVSDKKRTPRGSSRLDTKPRIEAAPIDAIKIVEPPASMRFNPSIDQQASIQQAAIQQAAIQQASIQQAAIQALRINISGDFRTEIQTGSQTSARTSSGSIGSAKSIAAPLWPSSAPSEMIPRPLRCVSSAQSLLGFDRIETGLRMLI